MKTVKLLEITSCYTCPQHEMVHDPGSDDSFDQFDEAMVCKLTGPEKYPDRSFEHRAIVRCERSLTVLENVKIPAWCPLPNKKKRSTGSSR